MIKGRAGRVAVLAFLFLALGILHLRGQSSNFKGATSRLDASVLQNRNEKGQPNGYVPLNSSGLVDPTLLFPNFAGSPDNTVWVKSGSTLVPLSGIGAGSGGWSANNILIGAISTGVYGVKIASGASALYLRGGTNNQVALDANQTFGASDSGHSSLVWYVGPSGNFKLGGGELNGALDLKTHAIANVTSIAGDTAALNLTTGSGISVTSGNFTFQQATGAGVVVPSTGSAVNTTFALNATAANALYGRKDLVNTWALAQTFTVAPLVPDSSFAISKVTGLQASLDTALKRDGSNAATGNVSLGGNRITNLADPVGTQDAVTLAYFNSNALTTGVTSLTLQGGIPVSLSGATGAITLSMTAASGSTAGYLTAANWTTFNTKQSAISTSGPLALTSNTLSIATANATTTGALSFGDWNTFNNKQATLSATGPLALSSNTISIATATGTTAGALSAADWTTFNAKQAPITATGALSLVSGTLSISTANSSTSGILSASDWNTFNAKQTPITASGSLSLSGGNLTVSTATSTTTGVLTFTDWNTFNAKQAPITATGALTLASGTLSIATANTTTTGALTFTDWNTFNSKQAAITATGALTLSSGTLSIATAGASTTGALSFTDYNTFAARQKPISITAGTPLTLTNGTTAATLAMTQVSSTTDGFLSATQYNTIVAGLGGGGGGGSGVSSITIAGGTPMVASSSTGAVTLSMPVATTTVNGFLSSTDWNKFNNSANMITSVSAPLVITSGALGLATANTTTTGAISFTDWNTFNAKANTAAPTFSGAVTMQGTLTLTNNPLAITSGGTGSTTAAGARTALGVAINTDVQQYSAKLLDLANASAALNYFAVGNGSGYSLIDPASARSALGLGSAALASTSSFVAASGGVATGLTANALTSTGANLGTPAVTGDWTIGTGVGGTSAVTMSLEATPYVTQTLKFPVRGGTNTIVAAPTSGTAGQVLISAGPSAPPYFGSLAAGGSLPLSGGIMTGLIELDNSATQYGLRFEGSSPIFNYIEFKPSAAPVGTTTVSVAPRSGKLVVLDATLDPYGPTGYVLTAQGTSAAPVWTAPSTNYVATTGISLMTGNIVYDDNGTTSRGTEFRGATTNDFIRLLPDISPSGGTTLTLQNGKSGRVMVVGSSTNVFGPTGAVLIGQGTGTGPVWSTTMNAAYFASDLSNSPTAPTASGSYSMAMGYGAVASGPSGSTALGYQATAAGTSSISLGLSYSSGQNAFAANTSSSGATYGALGTYTTAIGYQEKVDSSSPYSAAIGGQTNWVTGSSTAAGILGGTNNSISGGNSSVIDGGSNNQITNSFSWIGAGNNNSVSGQYSLAGGYYSQVAGHNYSAIFGSSGQTMAANDFVIANGQTSSSSSNYNIFRVIGNVNSGNVQFGRSGQRTTFSFAPTSDRTVTFPDQTGSVAMTSYTNFGSVSSTTWSVSTPSQTTAKVSLSQTAVTINASTTTGAVAGQTYTYIVSNTSGASQVLTWGSNFKANGTQTILASGTGTIQFVYDSSANLFTEVSRVTSM